MKTTINGEFLRPVQADVIYERAYAIGCGAIQGGEVVYTDYAKNDPFLNVSFHGQTEALPEEFLPGLGGIPDNCPLSFEGNRTLDDFADACGNCAMSTLIHRTDI